MNTSGFTIVAGYGKTMSGSSTKASLSPVSTSALENFATVELYNKTGGTALPSAAINKEVLHQFLSVSYKILHLALVLDMK